MGRKNPKPTVSAVSLCGGLISFVTNAAPSLLDFPNTMVKHIKALSSLLRFGAEIEQLSLDTIKDHRSIIALGEALHDSDTIASVRICGLRPQHNFIIRAVAEALKNQKSLRKVYIESAREDGITILHTHMTSEIAEAFQPTSRIENLSFSGSMLHSSDATTIILRGIRNLRSLGSLELDWISDQNANEFADTLKFLPQLREVSLLQVGMSADGGKIIGPALSKLTALKLGEDDAIMGKTSTTTVLDGMVLSGTGTATNLQNLTLSSRYIGAPTTLSLARLVQHAPHLRRLDLYRSCIDRDSGVDFGKALKHCARCLEELDITHCMLRSEAIAAICDCGLLRLRSLCMDGNFSCGVGSRAVSESLLAKNSSIQRLSMRQAQLLESDARKLGKGLAGNCSLLFLDLSSNMIFDKGAAALLDPLPAAHPLQELDLGRCDICSVGAAAVGRFILRSYCIRRVSVPSNKIGREGFRAIAESSGGTLEYLDLSGNHAGDEGVIQIAEKVIRGSKSMLELELADTAMRNAGVAAVVRAIEERNGESVLRTVKMSVTEDELKKIGPAARCIICHQ